jgi:multidrug efflux system outer membrane protein
MRKLALIAVVLLPAGCLVGPNYERPQVATPPAYLWEAPEAQATADLAWWQGFGDPVLDALVADAVAGNKSIAIAAANVEQAAALLGQARSPLWPQLGYGADGARSRGSETDAVPIPGSVPNPQTSYQAIAGVSWELDLWGRVRRLSEAARASLSASEEARRGVIVSVVGTVANAYLQLRALDEQLVIARRTLATYEDSVRLFELQFKHGLKPRMTVEQARIQLETAAAMIPDIETQIAQTENLISTLLGRNPGPVARGRSILELTAPEVPAGVPSELLERRPDIRQAEHNLVAVNAQLGAAKALYFPTISLTGAFGQASADLGNLFKGASRTWSYGGSITGPLFAGGAISSQVRQVEAARKEALLAYESAIQNAFADVDNALVARAKLVEQVQAEERLVIASREYARLARLQFDGGVTPYFTVLQAEQQLFPSELRLVQYRAALGAAVVNIYKAMGGGWVDEAERAAAAGGTE